MAEISTFMLNFATKSADSAFIRGVRAVSSPNKTKRHELRCCPQWGSFYIVMLYSYLVLLIF